VAYLALAVTPFPGLRQMAVFATTGLAAAWLTVVLWYPRLSRPAAVDPRAARWFRDTRVLLAPSLSLRARVVIGLVGAAVIAGGLVRVTGSDDIRELQNAPEALLAEQREVSRILDAASPAQFFLVAGASEDEVLGRQEELRGALDSLVAAGTISGYEAVSEWVPSHDRQTSDARLVAATLYRRGGALDALAVAIHANADFARRVRTEMAASAEPLGVTEWLATPAAAPFRRLWIADAHGRVASVVALKGVGRRAIPALRAIHAEGVTWVDATGAATGVFTRYRRVMGEIVILGYALVLVAVLARYGRRGWRVIAPSIVASLLALAVFGYIGQPLGLFHVLGLLMVFGSGVDYGIFLAERPAPTDGDAWLTVGIAAASTLLSFGLLTLSTTPALHTFGETMLIGVASSALLAPYFCTRHSVQAPSRYEISRRHSGERVDGPPDRFSKQ
jgi:predicted exporter